MGVSVSEENFGPDKLVLRLIIRPLAYFWKLNNN
jgi:hypothetical protein